MDSTGEFNFESELSQEVNFIGQILNHLEFLKLIDQLKVFYTGKALNRAIYRYETLWIPFCISLDSAVSENRSEICPPMDIAWVWHCHILSSNYFKDLKSNYGKIIDHKCIDIKEIKQKQDFTKQLWQNFTQIDYDYENNNCVDANYANFKSNFSGKLAEISQEQKNFFYQVSLPHYTCTKFLQMALNKYKKFILLKKKYPDMNLKSCFAIDLVWRTHQLNPSYFYSDMKKIFSSKTNFFCNYTINKSNDLSIANIWIEEYKEDFVSSGCVYRGLNPNELDFHPRKSDIDYYMDKVAHIEFLFEVSGEYEENDDFFFQASFLNSQEETILGDISTNGKASFTKTIILKDYEHMSTLIKLTLNQIQPKINKLKGLLKSSSSLIKDFKLIFKIEMQDLAKLRQKSINVPIRLNSEKNLNLKLSLNLINLRNELNFGLKRNPFKYVKFSEIIKNYKFVFDLKESFVEFDQVLKANHLIKAIGADKDVFEVEVLHIPSIFWSSIKILNENKTICTAHFMDSNHLPRSDFVENVDFAFESSREKAILIRDCDGDFAIIKGKWIINKDVSSKSLLIKIVFLRDTRCVTKIEIKEDLRTFTINAKSGECYGAHLDKGLVWLNSNEIDVKKFEWSLENHLAIVFSISVLYAFTSNDEILSASSSESYETEDSEYSSPEENLDE